jgi:hypothetical protein
VTFTRYLTLAGHRPLLHDTKSIKAMIPAKSMNICSSLLMRLHGRETRPKRIARHPPTYCQELRLSTGRVTRPAGLQAGGILISLVFIPSLTEYGRARGFFCFS